MSEALLLDETLKKLSNDPYLGFKNRGQYLQQGTCPECGKKELFVKKSDPWRVSCNRTNKCGYTETTRQLYPELYENYSKRFPASDSNPNATAEAYLTQNRHFPISELIGSFEQGSYKIRETQEWCDTVRVPLNESGTTYWERLIDKQKADGQRINFGGKRHKVGDAWPLIDPVKGKWWMPPKQEINKGDTVYWVEGIFHAWALYLSGYKVVACLAAGYFPYDRIKPYLDQDITWVLALDDDNAGRMYMLRHSKKLKDQDQKVKVCLTGTDKDWDDLYRLKKINEKFMSDGEYRGQMFAATNINWKAYAHYRWKKTPYSVLEYDNRLYSVKVNLVDLTKALDERDMDDGFGYEPFVQSSTIKPISNFYPEMLYAERDELMDEKFYMFRIKYNSNNPEALIALEGTNIESASSFHKAVITKGYGKFSGSSVDMSILHDHWLNRKIKEICSIPFAGYHTESKTYVYQDFAYSNGEKLILNDEGYFQTKHGGIKTSLRGFKIQDGSFSPDWIENYITAFSFQGLSALAFWLGSLFVQQIRENQSSFPFFELTGEPGAGKSTIIEFLWQLLGRDNHEGIDPNKATNAGRRRAFSQGSGMPVVLIESDRGDEDDKLKQKQFDFDELKPLYNGRSVGTLGVAKRGNDTEEPLFQGTLVFAQNAEVKASDATIQRIVHCHCTTDHHSPETRSIAEWFARQQVEDVAGFLQKALANEKQILTTFFREYKVYEDLYTKRGGIKSNYLRLIKTHAQLMACAKSLKHIFPSLQDKALDDLSEYLYGRALSRQERLADEHPLVNKFWGQYEYLNMQTPNEPYSEKASDVKYLNHHAKDGMIAINFANFRAIASKHGQEMLDETRLKSLLPGGRKYKFIDTRKVWSPILKRSLHCWVFEEPGGQESENP